MQTIYHFCSYKPVPLITSSRLNEIRLKVRVIKFNYISTNLIQYIYAARKSFNNVTVNYCDEPAPALRQGLIKRKRVIMASRYSKK